MIDLKQNLDPTGAIGIIYHEKTDKKEYLLIQEYSDKIGFCGGAKEDIDKNPEETIKREMFEELGVKNGFKIKKTNLQHVFTYGEHKKERFGQRAVNQVYVIKFTEDLTVKNFNEIKAFYWCSEMEVLDKVSFEDLKEIFIEALKEI